MAQGYTVIEKGTFDGTTNGVTFTSIPQTYQHLEFSFAGISDQASSTRSYVYLQFNSGAPYDSNYAYVGWFQESGTQNTGNSSAAVPPVAVGRIGGASSQTNSIGFVRLYVLGYSNTTLNGKNWMMQSGNQDNSTSNVATNMLYGGVFRATSKVAITEMQVTCYTGSGTVIESGGTYILAGWS
tara:strand:- start:687 stop:1235 length:549 start_codon:yes stop_codon:yes gene_type:complete